MVNCNPETVSTDYDTSDKLYFEPLTLEDVMNIVEREKPDGVIVQFGGQTPLKLALPLEHAGVPILGTSPDRSIVPKTASASHEVDQPARHHNSPITASPVLSMKPSRLPRGLAIRCWSGRLTCSVAVPCRSFMTATQLQRLHERSRVGFTRTSGADRQISRRRHRGRRRCSSLTARTIVIGGIMEHIERAGVHSGDSACSLPPTIAYRARRPRRNSSPYCDSRERAATCSGLMNVQFAVKGEACLCARGESARFADRTVCQQGDRRAAGQDWRLESWSGRRCKRSRLDSRNVSPQHISVKEAVFPFIKFPGVDTFSVRK